MRAPVKVLMPVLRALTIVLLVVLGSTVLMRLAPGYLSDANEMDARYADSARAQLAVEAARSSSLRQMLVSRLQQLVHGDLGTSRQYDVPVLELVRPRLAVSGKLLLQAIGSAWLLAFSAALLSSATSRFTLFWRLPAALLLAVPTAAMATVCLLADHGGPVLVMTLIVAARDFKFLDRLLRKSWHQPHLLQARAQGLTQARLLTGHILPGIAPQLRALATLSILTALGALVPVEVLFNVPGLGQLAWSAAMNRDLPVLLAVTMLMAVSVTCATMASDRTTDAPPAAWQRA
jgi:peptide/nickel transport system permease protein